MNAAELLRVRQVQTFRAGPFGDIVPIGEVPLEALTIDDVICFDAQHYRLALSEEMRAGDLKHLDRYQSEGRWWVFEGQRLGRARDSGVHPFGPMHAGGLVQDHLASMLLVRKLEFIKVNPSPS